MTLEKRVKIGIDLGGTKIAAIALVTGERPLEGRVPDDEVLFSHRLATPKGDYIGVLSSIKTLVDMAHKEVGTNASIGIGIPGSLSPQTGLVQNANSTWLNSKPLKADIEQFLNLPVKLANDANCLALSESYDGAAQGANVVFGVIIGTGCGGGLIVNGNLIEGRHAVGGEWGHTPLPWLKPDEYPGPQCWCGHRGCIETWVSGTGMEQDYKRASSQYLRGEEIVSRAKAGDETAVKCLKSHVDRLARSLAMVTNLYDPDVIVLGGGLSNLDHLYEQLPFLMRPFVFADHFEENIKKPVHGDASGVRGAARLWD